MALNTIHLFAGAGGGILTDLLLGHIPIAACEIEDYPRRVLIQRQLDGILPVFPIWDDIRTLRSDNPECTDAFNLWRSVSSNLAICGGFPCQDISAAGKGAGIDGERSGLWREMARVVREIRPACVFVENSPMLLSRGLGRVLGDLAAMGYDARWGVLGAHDAGFCINETGFGYLPTPSGVKGAGHCVGALGEWGGSSNIFRTMGLGNVHCPRFEEWTMGWPETWAELTQYETDKFHEWQHLHGSFFNEAVLF